MFSPLGSRTYRLFFAGQVASAVGDGMVSVALAFAVLQVTGSVAALGLVLGTRSAFTILGLLLGGTVADRFSQRPVMVVADATRCASQALLAGLLFSGSARLWELVVLSAVHGSCSAFFYPAVTALAPQLVQSSQLQQANALRWAADATGGVVGPAAAGLVVASASPAWAIAGDSLTFAVSAATLAALPLAPAGRAADASLIRQLVEGWREFASRPWLWTANIQAAATNGLLLAPFYVAGPFVSRERLGGPSAWGLILAAGGVGNLTGGMAALRLRPRRPMFTAALLFAGFAVPVALLALATPAWMIAASALIASAGGIAGNVFWETTVQERVPAHALSRVTAYDWFSSLVAQPAGFATAGVLVDRLGATDAAWIMLAAGCAVCFVIPWAPSLRRIERFDEPDLPEREADHGRGDAAGVDPIAVRHLPPQHGEPDRPEPR